MAYEKQTWVTGEVITEEKLNHIEDGIAEAGGVDDLMVVHVNSDGVADKTADEIITHTLYNHKPAILVKYLGGKICHYMRTAHSSTGAPEAVEFLEITVSALNNIGNFDIHRVDAEGKVTTTYKTVQLSEV